MKLFINPSPIGAESHVGGIWRVVSAQARWLPELGVEIVPDKDSADVVAIHAGEVTDTDLPVVCHNHGLYWTGDMHWTPEYWGYNNNVVEALRRAHAITVPSEWVANPIRRDMRVQPIVIPHGVNVDQFTTPTVHDKYVLWAKPRVDVVSDPRPVNELARRVPKTEFWTTYGMPTENVKVLGVQPYKMFQEILSRAAVWLATTRETGDIASREAMAYGVPVLGWDWGATAELVKHKETGYLVPPYDYDAMVEGLGWLLARRDTIGQQAREDILARFRWQDIMRRYVQVYEDVLESYLYDITIVIPAYNYGQYLPECLDSVLGTLSGIKAETIVVDDASTDNTQDVLSHYDDINVIRHERNMGLSAALNTGHRAAQGKYIVNLDADNVLLPSGMVTLYRTMEAKPWVDVGTAPYTIMNTDRVHGGDVDVRSQLDHYNQIPSTCLMRSRSIKRVGGYRRRQLKNEDGEFWCRAMSMGLRCEKLSDQPVFSYRWHGENKSALEGGEDDPEGVLSWNFHYPWRKHRDIAPFAMLGHPEKGSWPVYSRETPHISVIIPVGPGHDRYVMDALDSVIGQTFQDFECIVVNDTGEPLDLAAMGHPWPRVIDTPGRMGPAIARNTGIAAARADLIAPLDADDMYYPSTLRMYYEAWLQYPDSLVYGDCDTESSVGKRTDYHSGPWSMEGIRKQAIYQDAILYAKSWWQSVGGYPTDIDLWEDWLFGVMLHMIGVGATYIERPWGVYRHWTSLDIGRSKSDGDNVGFGQPEFKEKLQRAYAWIEKKEREIQMACKKCGKGRSRSVKSVSQRAAAARAAMVTDGEDVVILCERENEGYFSVNSKAVRGRKYRFKKGTVLTVPAGDAWIATMVGFRRLKQADLEPERVDLPKEPQKPPEFETTMPAPITAVPDIASMPNIKEELPTSVPDGVDAIPVDVLKDISHVNVAVFRGAGFETLGDVRKDIEDNGGRGILSLHYVGRRTLNKIKEVIYGGS
jgi:glycosyltransferase involved in cell wall biosynthesis